MIQKLIFVVQHCQPLMLSKILMSQLRKISTSQLRKILMNLLRKILKFLLRKILKQNTSTLNFKSWPCPCPYISKYRKLSFMLSMTVQWLDRCGLSWEKRLRTYEARVRFGTRVWVRDSAIFEKGGCECGRTRRLKNY